MSENEIKPVAFDISELRYGCIQHPKRWSGDTHDDLGGSVNEPATDALMAAAADEIDRLTAERDAAVADAASLRERMLALEAQRDDFSSREWQAEKAKRQAEAECDLARRKLSVAVAERNALVADAERYRWLREALLDEISDKWDAFMAQPAPNNECELDAAIDATMRGRVYEH